MFLSGTLCQPVPVDGAVQADEVAELSPCNSRAPEVVPVVGRTRRDVAATRGDVVGKAITAADLELVCDAETCVAFVPEAEPRLSS